MSPYIPQTGSFIDYKEHNTSFLFTTTYFRIFYNTSIGLLNGLEKTNMLSEQQISSHVQVGKIPACH